MSEGVPKRESGEAKVENGFDREMTEQMAAAEAVALINERIDATVHGPERFEAIQDIMMELSENMQENHHTVEAMARMLKILQPRHEFHVSKETYPVEAQAVEELERAAV